MPIIDYAIRCYDGGVPDGALCTSQAIHTSQRPLVVAAISATDSAYGVEIGSRAEICGMVKRYEVAQAVSEKV